MTRLPRSPRLLFGKDRRLRKRADFVRVQASPHRATTRHFVFLFAPAAPAAPAAAAAPPSPATPAALARWRVGVVVTRKLGGAVERNRIKRVCRECFRTNPDLFLDGVDVVVIARAGAHLLSKDEVLGEWRGAARHLARKAEAALEKTEK